MMLCSFFIFIFFILFLRNFCRYALEALSWLDSPRSLNVIRFYLVILPWLDGNWQDNIWLEAYPGFGNERRLQGRFRSRPMEDYKRKDARKGWDGTWT